MALFEKTMVILEMANNHMGDVAHGKELIEAYAQICRAYPDMEFVFKLQYRQFDTFIHPAFKARTDLKFIRRFQETRLDKEAFEALIETMRACGFKVMVTPFDNASVPILAEQGVDYIKIASCSFGDWPLLEEIAAYDLPVVASTAGAELEVIDNVVSFLKHRHKNFMLMHCVGEYPTPAERMHLGQIVFLKNRYKDVPVGLSTHEEPDNTDLVKMAVAMGCRVFEKHVALPTKEYAKNAYSTSPEEFAAWLAAMREAMTICGPTDRRVLDNDAESKTLRELRRGVSLRRDMKRGEVLTQEDVYFAFPPVEGQLTANDWSKYARFTLSRDVRRDEPVLYTDVTVDNRRKEVERIISDIGAFVKKSGVVVPEGGELEISHHYGLERFYEYGLAMMTVVNREYCKKLLILLPGQKHPQQYHRIKEESFFLLYGDLALSLDGETRACKVGEVVTIEPGVKHAFSTRNGAIVEEISSTHVPDDSYYTDAKIMQNSGRKTFVKFWMDR